MLKLTCQIIIFCNIEKENEHEVEVPNEIGGSSIGTLTGVFKALRLTDESFVPTDSEEGPKYKVPPHSPFVTIDLRLIIGYYILESDKSRGRRAYTTSCLYQQKIGRSSRKGIGGSVHSFIM